jgi:diacylglycerol kinase (ATP)
MQGLLAHQARRFWNTVVWSLAGWRAAWASEASLRQWTAVNAASAALAFWVDLSPAERALILALGLMILVAELLNTAIETAVNYISTEQHPLARKAKDCGSAGVAVAALAAGVAWVVVLLG